MRNKALPSSEWTELDPESSPCISSREDTPALELTNEEMISPPTTPEPDSPTSCPRQNRRKRDSGAPTAAGDSVETAVDDKKDRKRRKRKKRKLLSPDAMDLDSSPSPEPSSPSPEPTNEEKPADPSDEEKPADSSDEEPVTIVVQNLRERNPRWKNEGEPVNDLSQVPEGWNCMEPDLEETDYDAQIERCWERIEDGYMVNYFKKRLETLLDARRQLQYVIDSEPRGLDLKVVHRLQSLGLIRRHLKDTNDEFQELPNVRAIMKAYRSGKLEWGNGTVTYWAGGKMLGEPRAFDWDECVKLNEETKEQGGFWVEGLYGPEPIRLGAFSMVIPCRGGDRADYYTHTVRFSVQLNKHVQSHNMDAYADMATTQHNFDFLDDTGAEMMTLYRDDYELMAGPLADPATMTTGPTADMNQTLRVHCRPCILGFNTFVSVGGPPSVYMIVAVKVNMPGQWSNEGYAKLVHSRITAAVTPFRRGAPDAPEVRLSGPWLRHMLYTATSPDNSHRLLVANQKGALLQHMTSPFHGYAVPPMAPLIQRRWYYHEDGEVSPGPTYMKRPWSRENPV